MTSDSLDIKDLIYTPSETSTIGLESSKKVSTYSDFGLPLGIEGIDGYFAPVMPGQLAVIIGQTSHYKSGMVSFLSEQAAGYISETGRDNKVQRTSSRNKPIPHSHGTGRRPFEDWPVEPSPI